MSDLKDFYDELYSHLDEGSLFNSPMGWVKTEHLERFDAILAEIKRLFNSRIFSLIDIGGAEGTFFHKLRNSGLVFTYVNTDFSIANLKKAKTTHIQNLVLCDAHNLPFRDAVFDLALCSEVLEHVVTPRRIFFEAARVIKGYGLFTTPTIGITLLDKVFFDRRAKMYTYTIRSRIAQFGSKQIARSLHATTGAVHISIFTISNLRELYSGLFEEVATRGIFFGFPQLSSLLRLEHLINMHRKIQEVAFRHIPVFHCGFLGNQCSLLVLKKYI